MTTGRTRLKKIWLLSDPPPPVEGLPAATEEIRSRLRTGQPQLQVLWQNFEASILIWVPVSSLHGRQGIAVGEVSPAYLWSYALGFVPPKTSLSILDATDRPLLQMTGSEVVGAVLDRLRQTSRLYVEVEDGAQTWLVGEWDLFLMGGFSSGSWKILVSEPKETAFAGLSVFKKNAGLTALATFWVILLASSILIRKTLSPLQQLSNATTQVSQGNFNFQLKINSRDEFEALSESFNGMLGKIQQQIARQKNMGNAVRDILGAGEQEEIIQNFFTGLARIVPFELARLTIFKPAQLGIEKSGSSWICHLQNKASVDVEWRTELCATEISALREACGIHLRAAGSDFPVLLKPFATLRGQNPFIFQIQINSKLEGILILADNGHEVDEELLLNVRQLADQLGVSLSRAAMVNELDALNMGILTALARTVDANSRWTHGHSERVTDYALQIAREMGCSEQECIALHRAGLLHDLGKVSIPAEILNKPGKLTAEEYSLMQNHPAEADRIIEPIHVFGEVRPIVRQHHERWDGAGYPDGLKGEEIHLGARVLAVADVYDALYSDRPYRESWSQEKVIDYLRKEAGYAFDPKVVRAFLRLLRKTAA